MGSTASVTTAGCLGLFSSNPVPESDGTDDRYTTVEKTNTFGFGGTQTPFPPVQGIYRGSGSGILVIAYFDYSHEASLQWWREEYPELTDLVDEGRLRLTLHMFPKPVDQWSVMLPSALFEVRSRSSREAAWTFHERLVSADEYSMDLLEQLASDVGVPSDAITEAAETRRRRNQAFSDKAMGEDSGVESLPAFRWGMERIDGTSAEDIRKFVEEQLD
ncbi:DsbA family protein [Halorarum salinum]|uniref:Thioredoxin domain-containing protein n=1 Tax=Halorarum salinum TaxID=2743089 RepID=A0A7D5QA21_9EURY|nr:thioredoxin domain-containing protein [Halobaculum salinum]QLG62256.1 thioredoxin domain-containing protein [Halobaculum salinum]